MQGGQGVCAVRAAGGEAEVQVEEAVEHPAAAGGDGGGREVGAGGGLGAGGQAGQESCGGSLVVWWLSVPNTSTLPAARRWRGS